MKRIKYGSLVEIEWADATSWSGWKSLEEAETLTPMTIKTLGYYLGGDDDFVRLARNIPKEDDGVGDVIVVPTPWVVKVRRVK